MENSQGKWAKPPRSFTIDGTAVARMVASIAISPTLSMTDSRMGPRSDRRPTAARELVCCSVEWAIYAATSNAGRAFPGVAGGRKLIRRRYRDDLRQSATRRGGSFALA